MKNWIVVLVVLLATAGCGNKQEDGAAAKAATPKEEQGGRGGAALLVLDAAEVAALGIATAQLAPVTRIDETAGFAVALDHERIAQVVADLAAAQAAQNQSRAALARLQRLAGGEGAATIEALEAAQRQAVTDGAALALAERKAATVLGQHPPWRGEPASALRDALAAGRSRLIRVTFPLGALQGGVPGSLRFARIGGGVAAEHWRSVRVWAAPADPEVPGRSFHAVLDTEAVAEGEHLSAWAAQGAAVAGVVVPAAALLADSGRYWCYIERAPGKFERVALDTDKPTDEGYFVAAYLKPGDRVVVAAAGLLLARELHPGAEAD